MTRTAILEPPDRLLLAARRVAIDRHRRRPPTVPAWELGLGEPPARGRAASGPVLASIDLGRMLEVTAE